jgi:hypothetical protein
MSTWIPSLLLHKLFLGSHVLGQQHGQPLFDWQCPLRSFVACSHRCPIVLCHAINQVALARRTIEFDHCIYLSNIDTSFCVMCCPPVHPSHIVSSGVRHTRMLCWQISKRLLPTWRSPRSQRWRHWPRTTRCLKPWGFLGVIQKHLFAVDIKPNHKILHHTKFRKSCKGSSWVAGSSLTWNQQNVIYRNIQWMHAYIHACTYYINDWAFYIHVY